MQKPTATRFITTTILATVLSALFIFLGAPVLRVLRNVFGSPKYWGAGGIVCGAMWFAGIQPTALILASLWITIGIYSEFEERGWAGRLVATLSVFLGSAVLILGGLVWSRLLGVDIGLAIKEGVDGIIQQYGANSNVMKIDVDALVQMLPSILVLILMTSLGFALMFDRKVSALLGLQFERVATHMRLLEFRTPDAVIWLLMASFLFSFVKVSPPMVSVVASNVLNILMGIYFFQGLAVLEVFFLTFRVGNLMRFFVYFFVVGQLFFLLSAVGIIDYWVDFRARLKRQRKPGRDQKNEERV